MRIKITLGRLLVVLILLAILVALVVVGGDPKPATAATVHSPAVATGALPQLRTNPAASIPAANMPQCGIQVGSLANVGGWAVRDFVSNGSFATSTLPLQNAPIRPLGTRLGEPCFDENGYLALAARFTEIPVPMLDTNGDGKDDGAPAATPPGGSYSESVYGSTRMTLLTIKDREWRASSVWHRMSYYCVSVTGSLTGLGVFGIYPVDSRLASGATNPLFQSPWNDPAGGVPRNFIGSGVWFAGTGSVLYNDGNSTPVSASCPVGTTHYVSVMDIRKEANPNRTGIMWDPPKAPVRFFLAPTADPSLGTGGDKEEYALGQRYYGGTQGARIAIPGATPAAQTGSYVKCSTAYTGGTETVMNLDYVAGDGVYPTDGEPPVVVDGVAQDWSVVQNISLTSFPQITSTNCPFVTEVGMWVRTFQGTTEAEYGSVWTTWSADRWRTNQPYSGESEQELICQINPNAAGCYEYNNPPYVDGTDFATVCADPPAFEWGDFGWLNDFVGHFSKCLFTPVNGFDKNGQIAASWANSAGGQIGSLVTAGYSAMSVTGTCGSITQGAVIGGSPVNIDTCAWDWASPMRVFLYWSVLVLGYAAVFSFATSATISLPSKSSTPEPSK